MRFDKLDKDEYKKLLKKCRLKPGEIWYDPLKGHKVACLDSSILNNVKMVFGDEKSKLAIHDPPYNFIALEEKDIEAYIIWCKEWVNNTDFILDKNSSLYIWLGADQDNNFSPLPEFILMMKEFKSFKSKSFITLRNQRGYGTQKNWMSVRQECLYYIKGSPYFKVQYTDIPKVLKGYYKKVGDKKMENIERSKSDMIRPGNVWFDIQQVFYKLHENVEGCYLQKPLKAIERIVLASSEEKDLVNDFFSHSGTTLIACEKNNRKCYTLDIDPIFCEISIKRLENFRNNNKEGFQMKNPFDKIENKGILKV
jgi:site-specific DNA-methyltransferase (adenine-specific)